MERPKLGRPPVYDWDTFTNGEEHTLIKGVDFTCHADSFGLLCRTTARRRDLEVHPSIWSDDENTYVTFQFTTPKEQKKSA